MPVYLNEKTKKYYVSIRYVDWQGIRRRKKKEGFSLAREAKAYEADFLSKMTADCNIKFSALCEYYLEDFKNRHKLTTYKVKESCINTHFIDAFGNLPLNAITSLTVRKWQNIIMNKDYSKTYQRKINSELSAIFNYACKYYKLATNPVREAGTIGKKNAEGIDFWTVDEFKTFITTLSESKTDFARVADNQVLETVFTLLFYTGIRLGELLALTIADFAAPNNGSYATVSITKSYASVDGKDYIQEPKTPKSKRSITIPVKVWCKIQEHISRMVDPAPQDRLFFMLSKHNLGRALKAIAAEAGVKAIRVHDLRHSHASLLINMDINILAISERLGHEDIQTTLNIYGHLYPSKAEQIADKLEKI